DPEERGEVDEAASVPGLRTWERDHIEPVVAGLHRDEARRGVLRFAPPRRVVGRAGPERHRAAFAPMILDPPPFAFDRARDDPPVRAGEEDSFVLPFVQTLQDRVA